MERGNLGELWDRAGHVEKLALIEARPHRGRSFTYAELDDQADSVARGLLARGLKEGESVAILAENRAEYVTAYLGIMRAGLVAVPISHRFPGHVISGMLADASVRLVFTDAERKILVGAGYPVVDFDSDWSDFLVPGRFAVTRPEPGATAMVLFTSGSTGRPKGVPLSHDGQLWAISARARIVEDFARHRVLVAAPLFHMNGLFTTKFVLAMQATVILLPQFSAPGYIRAIDQFRCTWLTSVPTMLALVAREKELLRKADLSSVEVAAMGSAPATEQLVEQVSTIFPKAKVTVGYGTTEAGPSVFGPHPQALPRPPLSLGFPLPTVGVRLISKSGNDAAEGVAVVRTPAVTKGYLNLPEKSAEVLEDGWYNTKDIMRRDELGFYYFVGRVDDMFVCGGENVFPEDVERLLETHPKVAQACVVPIPDEIKGQKPIAFIVTKPGCFINEEEIKSFALQNAPAFQHPRRVLVVERMPLLGSNKFDRGELRRIAQAAKQSDGLVRGVGSDAHGSCSTPEQPTRAG